MADKVLKVRMESAYVVYDQLKRVAPQDFPSIEEMEALIEDILPALEPHTGEFLKFREKTNEVVTAFRSKKLAKEDADAQLNTIRDESLQYETAHGKNEEEIVFDKASFGMFFQMFERWGKKWFGSVEDFIRFRRAMNEANSRPSDKDSKEEGAAPTPKKK